MQNAFIHMIESFVYYDAMFMLCGLPFMAVFCFPFYYYVKERKQDLKDAKKLKEKILKGKGEY